MSDPTEVRLRHYDLSNGLARQMSPMLLGRLVETIPHTAVEVFGLEWFYGGGIQSLPSREVVQVYGFEPVEVLPLGRTTKTKAELLRFLQPLRLKYAPERYDLFRNNCNNFSDEVARFLLDGAASVPEKIMRLPEEVLATPLGAMIAGMMQGPGNPMQSRFGGPSSDPFAAFGQRPGEEGPAPAVAATAAPSSTASLPPFPLLSDAASAPLVSSSDDGALLPAVVARLVAVHAAIPASSPHRLSGDDLLLLEAVPSMVQAAIAQGLIIAAPEPPDAPPMGTQAPPPAADPRWARAVIIISQAFREWPRALSAAPSLDLLRALALVPESARLLFAAPQLASSSAGSPATRPDSVVWDVLEGLHAAASAPASSPVAAVFGSQATDALALALLSNATATRAGRAWALSPSVLPRLADIVTLRYVGAPAALQGSPESAGPRTLAAALALNIARSCTVTAAAAAAAGDSGGELSDVAVQLLLGILQSLPPSDGAAPEATRLLLAVGVLLLRGGPGAASLVLELGLDEAVRAVARSSSSGGGAATPAAIVAGEIEALLDRAVAAAASA